MKTSTCTVQMDKWEDFYVLECRAEYRDARGQSGVMSHTNPDVSRRVELAPVAEMEAYGASIAAELAGAEAELHSPRARPFHGLSEEVMADIARLREDQLQVFRQHIEIEQNFTVPRPGAEAEDVRDIRFSSIGNAMRQKEVATSQLLDRLDAIDRDLRHVIGKFEGSDTQIQPNDTTELSSTGFSGKEDQIQHVSGSNSLMPLVNDSLAPSHGGPILQ